jgi:hypothetical protein
MAGVEAGRYKAAAWVQVAPGASVLSAMVGAARPAGCSRVWLWGPSGTAPLHFVLLACLLTALHTAAVHVCKDHVAISCHIQQTALLPPAGPTAHALQVASRPRQWPQVRAPAGPGQLLQADSQVPQLQAAHQGQQAAGGSGAAVTRQWQ